MPGSLTDLPSGASQGAQVIHALYGNVLALAILLSLAALVPLVVFVVRYRWKPGEIGPARTMSRRSFLVLQAAFLIVPSLGLGAVGVWSEQALVAAEPPEGTLHVQVIGHQWLWEFRYESNNTTLLGELRVPAREVVDLNVTSADVVHSLFVPDLALRVDAVPGRFNHERIYPTVPGVYEGRCGQFCGIGHPVMPATIVVEG
jgi:heme/copper-type cytochrome/quinol oxidase subunit 2